MLMPRGLGLTCPPGQSPTNMYDGSVKCCGGPTPESDPCSYLNSAGYVATQAKAQADAIAGDAGNASALLAQIAGYPMNVQNDAIRCKTNPGKTFIDDMGISVTCPSSSYSDITTGGQPFSTFSIQTLAAMLAGSATPANETLINTAGTTIPGAVIQAVVPPPGPVIAKTSGSPAGTPGTSPTGGGSPAPAGGSTNTGGGSSTMDLSFLTNSSLINGVPNWMVGFGSLAILLILPSLLGGRR